MYGINVEPQILNAKVEELSGQIAIYHTLLAACEQAVASINAVNIGAHAVAFTAAHAQFIAASTQLAVLLEQARQTLDHTSQMYQICEHNNTLEMRAYTT